MAVVPDVHDLQGFCAAFPAAMRQRGVERAGARPREALVDHPLEAALDFARRVETGSRETQPSDPIRLDPTESDPMLQLHDPIRLNSQSDDANGNPVRRTRSTERDRRAKLATFYAGTPFSTHPSIRVRRCSSVASPPLARTPALTLGMALLLWRGMVDRPA